VIKPIQVLHLDQLVEASPALYQEVRCPCAFASPHNDAGRKGLGNDIDKIVLERVGDDEEIEFQHGFTRHDFAA
jgi:hypothetical protein